MVYFTIRPAMAAALVAGLTAFGHGLTYDIAVIKSDDGAYLDAYDMNSEGDIVGTAYLKNGDKEFYVYSSGHVDYLQVPGIQFRKLAGINDKGTIVGEYGTNANIPRSFIIQNGVFADIGTNSDYTTVYDVNENDQATGFYATADGHIHAYIAERSVVKDIGTLGYTYSSGRAINDLGQVVGHSTATPTTGYHAFLYNNGTMIDISPSGTYLSYGFQINNNGQVTIDAFSSADEHCAYLYSNGIATRLRLGFHVSSLNNNGAIAGTIADAEGNDLCVLYENGNYEYISSLIASLPAGWYASRPVKLNDNGQILCYGISNGLDPELWLLTPHAVPEPASLLGFAVPVLMLAARRARRPDDAG